MDRIRVLVVDARPAVADGLELIVRACRDFECIGKAESVATGLSELTRTKPDVLLLDVSLGLVRSKPFGDCIKRDTPDTKLVVISDDLVPDVVLAAMQNGALAFLPLHATRREICDTISVVMQGKTFLHPAVHMVVAQTVAVTSERPPAPLLSPREREVLIYARDELTMKEIAVELVISQETVKTHLKNAYAKLGVKNRASAIREATRRGILL